MDYSIKNLVHKDNKVRFVFYRDGVLWYEVVTPTSLGSEQMPNLFLIYKPIFRFPVPISDCGNGTFLVEDRAITYMRYIRMHLEDIKAEGELLGDK